MQKKYNEFFPKYKNGYLIILKYLQNITLNSETNMTPAIAVKKQIGSIG